MSIVTHFTAAPQSQSNSKKSLIRHLTDRIITSQEARAAAELKRHSHLLPRELDQITWKLSDRSEDSLPFVR